MYKILSRKISDTFYVIEYIIPAATFPEVRYIVATLELWSDNKWDVQIHDLAFFSEPYLETALSKAISMLEYREEHRLDK